MQQFITPQDLESARQGIMKDGARSDETDVYIADYLSRKFGSENPMIMQYNSMRAANKDPRAVSAFLDYHAYGTTNPTERWGQQDPRSGVARKWESTAPWMPSQEELLEARGQGNKRAWNILSTVGDYATAPGRAIAGSIASGIGKITGADVSDIPEVRDLHENLRKSATTARVALPIAAGVGAAALPLTAAGMGISAGVTGAGAVAGEFTGAGLESAAGEEQDLLETAGKAALSGIGTAALDFATMGTFKLAKMGLARKSFEEIVAKGIEKGIKPQYRGAMRSSATALQEYNKKAGEAVAEIIQRAPTMEYMDAAGDVVSKGHMPTSLSEFSQAIGQAKKQIYDQYSALSKAAKGAGESIDLTSIGEKLLDYAADPVKQLADKSKTQYAKDMAVRMMKKGTLDPVQTENLIAELNQGLAKSYADKSVKGISEVDGSIASALREALDDIVMKATGQQYQPLKDAYGAFKSIEKDVGHRALIIARQNIKGLPEMTDIFTGGDIVAGMITGNPMMVAKGATGKAISMYYRLLNSPDNIIMKMFSQASRTMKSVPDDIAKGALKGASQVTDDTAKAAIPPIEPPKVLPATSGAPKAGVDTGNVTVSGTNPFAEKAAATRAKNLGAKTGRNNVQTNPTTQEVVSDLPF